MLIPKVLRQIPSPPKKLFVEGVPISSFLKFPRVAIVGSRNISTYGRQVTSQLAGDLAERGVVIISGLAYGVDAVAHWSALKANGKTIAVLPGPLDDIAPRGNRDLAKRIIESGGSLVSEYPSGDRILKTSFIARNRLVAGLAQVILIPEAIEKSGSLHTARFALDQGKDVLAVPGNINNPTSKGTNNLLRSGASIVTSYKDVIKALGLTESSSQKKHIPTGTNPNEQIVIDLIIKGITDGDTLQQQSLLSPQDFAQTLTMLEISGKISPLGANHWSLL